MNEGKEIIELGDIKLLVDTFYEKVKEDELLGPVFKLKIPGSWDKHLEIMYSFWQTLLLEERTYFGSPFYKHLDLPVEKQHFDRWLKLFYETLDELFTGEKKEEAKMRAEKMAEMFWSKIKYIRESGNKPLY